MSHGGARQNAGRKKQGGGTVSIKLSVSKEEREAVDEWRESRGMSRNAAIRYMIDCFLLGGNE